MATTKVKLTLMIDKKANKVLFAEGEKDSVDFLFSLLSLPIGNVIRFFRNSNMIGCIENLYQSLEILDEAYLQPKQNKKKASETPCNTICPQYSSLPAANSKIIDEGVVYYCETHRYVTDTKNTYCPRSCLMNQYLRLIESNAEAAVKNLVSYMMTDDLSVTPMSMISGVYLLQHYGKAIGALEKRVVEFGSDEGLVLLKNSLQSKTALTNVFLIKKELKDIELSNSNK